MLQYCVSGEKEITTQTLWDGKGPNATKQQKLHTIKKHDILQTRTFDVMKEEVHRNIEGIY